MGLRCHWALLWSSSMQSTYCCYSSWRNSTIESRWNRRLSNQRWLKSYITGIMVNSEIQAAKATGTPHQSTTLAAKLVNIFASPGDVFDDVVAEPIRPATWTIPTLMVCSSSLFLLAVSTPPEQISAAVRQLSEAGRLSPGAVTDVTNNWFSISAIMVFISGFVGTIWSALVLWVISRMFLKVAVPFSIALEVV